MFVYGAIVGSFLFYILDFGLLLHLEKFNSVEKFFLLSASAILFLSRQKDIFIFWCIFVQIVLVLLFGGFSSFPKFSWLTTIYSMNQFVTIYLFLAAYPREADRRLWYWMIALLPVTSSTIGLASWAAGMRPLFTVEFASHVSRFNGSLIPAYISATAMCGMAAVLQYTIDYRFRPILIFLFIANFIILLLGGGRITLAVALLVCSLQILTAKRFPLHWRVLMLTAGPVMLAGLVAIAGQSVLVRFFDSGENGRDIMRNYMLSLVDKYPLTGVGFGQAIWAVPKSVLAQTNTGAAHNDYLRLTTEIGYLGAILFYAILILVIGRTWWRGERNATPWIMLGGFLILMLTDNAIATPSMYILLVLGMLASAKFAPSARVHTASLGQRQWRMPAMSNGMQV